MKKEVYNDLLAALDKKRLPQHIAVIMDGNGRWATARHLPRSAGHKAGAEAMRRLTEICREIGVPYLSVYAFSTENWRRSSEEVSFLMGLMVEYLHNECALMNEQNIRMGFLGRRDGLPKAVLTALEEVLAATANNTAMTLNIAINYGGRDELLRATKKLLTEKIAPEALDEALFAQQLDTAGMPDPDLLIRPSGELRTSNFLLWQTAYSEFWFCDKLWPDFSKRDLLQAILDYQKRDRRFGGRKAFGGMK